MTLPPPSSPPAEHPLGVTDRMDRAGRYLTSLQERQAAEREQRVEDLRLLKTVVGAIWGVSMILIGAIGLLTQLP